MIELNAVIEGSSSLKAWTRCMHCLCRIGGESIVFSASSQELSLNAINQSRSVFSVARFPQKFFKQYEFRRERAVRGSRANSMRGPSSLANSGPRAFQVRSQGLVPVFRNVERDIARITSVRIHYIDYEEEDEGSESRVEIQVVVQSGIRKVYRLTCYDSDYEGTLDYPVHKENYPHKFEMQAKVFKKYIDSMSPQAEELSLSFKEDSLELNGFTEEVRWATELLKQPINTRIRLDYDQLDYLNLEDGMTITIRLKEFRHIASLADSMGARLLGWFKDPGMPMFFEILGGGMNGPEDLVDIRTFFIASGEKKKDTTRHKHYKERVNDLRGSPKPSGYMKKSVQPEEPMDLEPEPPVGWQEDDEDGDDEVIERALDQELLQFSQRVSAEKESAETRHDAEGDEFMSDNEVGPTPGKSQAYGLLD